MHNFQLYIFPFLLFCSTQSKEDILGIDKSTKQLLIHNGQVFDDKFQFRQFLSVSMMRRIGCSEHKAKTGIIAVTNSHHLCTTNTSNTTFNGKFKSMSDIKKELLTKCQFRQS